MQSLSLFRGNTMKVYIRMNAMKKILCSILLATTAYTANAQQVLSLDSCRALAMANNKELLISQEKINAAQYQRKAAFAN